MKKIILSLSAMAAICSCSEQIQNEVEATAAQTLTFTSSINQPTKVTDSDFEANDVIAITAFDADDTLVKDAASYTYDGSIFASTDPITYRTDSDTYSFYAIYPAVSSMQTSVDFYAKQDQSVDGAFADSDMLFASISSSDAIPQLTFSHKMSSIVVNIVGEGSGSVKFYAKTGLQYGVKTGSVATLGNSVTVTPASNGTASHKVIVAPQTVASGTTLATYTDGSLSYDWVLDANFEMVSGKQYSFNWSLADREVTLVSIINGWDPVDGGTIVSE